MASCVKPTMQDVAQAARVSTATVSRVLRGIDGASSEETAARVRRCAAELGYIVNGVASSMRSRQTRTVGLIIADVANPFFGQLASGVEDVLRDAGLSVILADTNNDVEREREAVDILLRQQVDALIVASISANGHHLRGAIARGIRLVLVDTELPDLPVDAIVIDDAAAARLAIDHLLSFGHERIAIVHGGTEASFDRGRLRGFTDSLERTGIRARPDYVIGGASTFKGGYDAVAALSALPDRPSAILATNNLMTVGALLAIADAGLEVPGDVSIISISDMEWFSIARPAITAVFQPSEELGRRAAERLLVRLRRKRQPAAERIELDIELRARDSVGPPPSSTAVPVTNGGSQVSSLTALRAERVHALDRHEEGRQPAKRSTARYLAGARAGRMS
jgi:LacI family transcriptional regulator